jgi:hypothetical protein
VAHACCSVKNLTSSLIDCCFVPGFAAALGNIVSVLGLFFFIYAVIGMNLWGAVKHAEYLTRQANFQHVGMALLTLFRMITGARAAISLSGKCTLLLNQAV